ncbi:NucA/NucB deoxyribonuclease domain-containing protein [Streptomyces lydicus]|uniref:NucA/NucB deoxyribonuclease domain-containing protein n=1 Tax=Streptomyces lydicus TaxID=47763 RepID=UPI0037B4C2C1
MGEAGESMWSQRYQGKPSTAHPHRRIHANARKPVVHATHSLVGSARPGTAPAGTHQSEGARDKGDQLVMSYTKRAAASGLAAFALLGTCTAAATAAPAPSVKYELKTTVTTAKPYAATRGATPNAGQLVCGVPVVRTNEFIRTFKCETLNARIDVLKIVNGVPQYEGSAYFQIQDEMRLNIRQTTWQEHLKVSQVRLVGKASGITITPTHSASGASVKAGGAMARPFALRQGSTHSGTVTYNAGTVTKGKKKNITPSHTFTGVKAGYTPARLPWKFEKARCDNMMGGRRAGCVFPAHAPIDGLNGVSSMASIPFVNTNMKLGQAGPHHFGKPGGTPLHRLTGETAIEANRRAACGHFPKPANGQYGWVVIPAPPGKTNATTPSCDEYPFASSKEGGNKYPADQKLKWVPKGSNDAQGRALNRFYGPNRVLDGDPYFINMGV